MARLPPAHDTRVTVERDLPATMADGAVLLADRWIPAPSTGTGSGATESAPIVLLRSPYGRRQLGVAGRLFAERGYQAVIQSCRGTFGSSGPWEPFRHEADDGRDTLAWLARQPWFSGTVVTFGPSYLGLTQWAVCADPPEFLRAMAPAVTATFFRDSVVYPGDALALETTVTWMHQLEHQELPRSRVLRSLLTGRRRLLPAYATLPLSEVDRRAVGRRVGFYQEWLAHDRPGDPWWDPVDFRDGRANSPPATLVAGWYDIFLANQVADFTALRAAGRQARLTIGPWTHASPGGMATSLRDALRWFDRHARETDPKAPAGEIREPAATTVRLFVMGAKRWVDLPDWPPPATLERWHLHPGGRLDTVPPGSVDAEPVGSGLAEPGFVDSGPVGSGSIDPGPDRFRYDPSDPTPSAGGASLDGRSAGRKDQRRREDRPDVLLYTSDAMTREVTIAGPVTLDLYFRSSLAHTDVFVRLCVVTARGRSYNVSDGIRRLVPEGPERPADGMAHLRIDMSPTAVTVRRGERIRLQVSSGAHPLYARNTGSGEPLGTATTLRTADQEVFRDALRPSAVELPMARL